MAGYSKTPLAKKLGIKENQHIVFIDAPANFEKELGALPPGVKKSKPQDRGVDLVLYFAKSQSDLKKNFSALAARMAPAGMLWVAWPKKASGVTTDLTESEVQKIGLAAGLGRMGIHRNVIHPKFGNFILLGTILLDAELDTYSQPLDYNPCLECKLCVSACPVGAISGDGQFNFSACYTHNYREFMGGFANWVETITSSKNVQDYRRVMSDSETVSMWQSLSFGANYKAAYCMAVCPAGEDVIAPFLLQRKEFLQDVVKPLQDKAETIYVVPSSDAEAHVARRFPHKKTKRVSNGLRPRSIRGFLRGLPLVFQRQKAKDLNAIYHFTFTGTEQHKATVTIHNQSLQVAEGHLGTADFHLTADSRTWLGFLAKERNLVWALLRRKIRITGSPRWLLAFGRCFPS